MAKYCTSCGSIIREGSRFCQKCGTPFSEACPQCGAQVSGTKFCPECGMAVESGFDDSSERLSGKKVTENIYPTLMGNTAGIMNFR